MDTTPVTPLERKGRSHTIVRTYENRPGVFSTRTTGIVGGTDKEALHHFNAYVRHARVNRKLIALMVVTATGEKLAEWSRAAEMAVA